VLLAFPEHPKRIFGPHRGVPILPITMPL